jgi:hypothetical protein
MFANNAPIIFGVASGGANAAWDAMIAYQFALATRGIQKANRKPTYGSSDSFAFEKVTLV